MLTREIGPQAQIPRVHDGLAGAGLRQDRGQRRRAPGVADLDDAGTDRLDRELGHDGRHEIRQRYDDAVTGDDARRREVRRQDAEAFGELAVREPRLGRRDRGRVGRPSRVRADPLRDERSVHAAARSTASMSACATAAGARNCSARSWVVATAMIAWLSVSLGLELWADSFATRRAILSSSKMPRSRIASRDMSAFAQRGACRPVSADAMGAR